MRIIQTPTRFYPYIGGTEQVAFYECKGLVRRGHSIKVICANEPAIGSSIVDGVEVIRLPYLGKMANTNITLSLGKRLMGEDFDIIHTHLPHPWSADISAVVSAIKKKPLFLTYHNDIIGEGVNRCIAGAYNLTILKVLLHRAYKIFITTPGYLERSSFLKPFVSKIVVTPLGVDTERFKPIDALREEVNTVFFLSRLDKFHRYKGLEYLLQALKKIASKVPVKLYIGGRGELLDYYKQLVKRNGLGDNVVFLGFLNEEDRLKYYNRCDVFVLPSKASIHEGFGLVALEAMACKKPVIVTDIVGVAPDVRKYNAGIVVRPANIEELSDALEFLLLDKDRRREIGNNAYDLVRNKYTWQGHVDIVEKEYLRLVR